MKPKKPLVWAYGVTTVPSRYASTLPTTLASLQEAGFDAPRLFVDGGKEPPTGFPEERVTYRPENIKTVGNWVLSLMELMIREPHADRYAVFQDDFITYPNLREYLDRTPYPRDGYLNLYTFPKNQVLAKGRGFYPSNQLGLGAVALVFNRQAALTLITSKHLADKPTCRKNGTRSVDGAIVTAMKKAGWKEYVHNPSLVQHIGTVSSMGNGRHPTAPSFLGRMYDALGLLPSDVPTVSPPVAVPAPEAPSLPHVVQPVVQQEEQAMQKQLGIIGHPGVSQHTDVAAVSLLQADRWLAVPDGARPEGVSTYGTSGKLNQLTNFVFACDTLLFFDAPLFPRITSVAKARGRRIVCVFTEDRPLPPSAATWVGDVDLFVCASREQLERLDALGAPTVLFSWPKGYAPGFDEQLRRAVMGEDDFPSPSVLPEAAFIPDIVDAAETDTDVDD